MFNFSYNSQKKGGEAGQVKGTVKGSPSTGGGSRAFDVNIMEYINCPILVIDARDYRVVRANRAAMGQGGPGELPRCFEISHGQSEPCSEAEHPCPLQEVKRKKRSVVVEHVHGSGAEQQHLQIQAHPLFDEQGGVTHVVEISMDITNLKRAENAVRDNLAFLQLLMDTMPTPIFYKDTEARYTGCNRAFCEFIGLRKEEILGRTVFDVAPSEYANTYHEYDLSLIREGRTQVYESPVRHADGTAHDVKFYKAAFTRSSGESGLIGIMLDITEQKQYQNELKAAKEQLEAAVGESETLNRQLEESIAKANLLTQDASLANLAKSEFLANMSHEIRTPMNAILGFAELLSQDGLTESQSDSLGMIRAASENLLNLINDILDFSKIEAGKLDIEMLDCEIDEILRVFEGLVRPMAIKKGLAFEVNKGAGLPAVIRTDPHRLRQCLINIATNAVKFTEKGHVRVNVTFERREGRGAVCFGVEDTGIGIPKEKQAQIFEPFAQADESTTRRYGGTGLGLTITRRLLDLLGAEVELVSEQGRGSTFTVRVPAEQGAPAAAAGPDAEPEKQTRPTAQGGGGVPSFCAEILVAEDNPSNQLLLQRILEKTQAHVEIVSDGQEAVRAMKDKTYDLVFMDMQMPVMSGYSATRAARNAGYTGRIVALTAHAMTGDREKCLEAGCDDYLSKPVIKEKLFGLMRKYIGTASGQTAETKTPSEA